MPHCGSSYATQQAAGCGCDVEEVVPASCRYRRSGDDDHRGSKRGSGHGSKQGSDHHGSKRGSKRGSRDRRRRHRSHHSHGGPARGYGGDDSSSSSGSYSRSSNGCCREERRRKCCGACRGIGPRNRGGTGRQAKHKNKKNVGLRPYGWGQQYPFATRVYYTNNNN